MVKSDRVGVWLPEIILSAPGSNSIGRPRPIELDNYTAPIKVPKAFLEALKTHTQYDNLRERSTARQNKSITYLEYLKRERKTKIQNDLLVPRYPDQFPAP